MENFFQYGETEIAYLKQADKRLAEVIDRIGRVERRVIPDLFAALVQSIVGQQISTKAHETIWRRIENALGKVTPEAIDRLPVEELRRYWDGAAQGGRKSIPYEAFSQDYRIFLQNGGVLHYLEAAALYLEKTEEN